MYCVHVSVQMSMGLFSARLVPADGLRNRPCILYFSVCNVYVLTAHHVLFVHLTDIISARHDLVLIPGPSNLTMPQLKIAVL